MNAEHLQKILLDYSLIDPHDRVIVGVSGGPDSVALLCLLCECDLDITLIPVYVDHGLRPEEIEKEKILVTQLANQYNLHHGIVQVDVAGYKKQHNTSLEESARILRSRALENKRREHNADCIAVAHTADDQVEEFFLRLLRGSGAKGLSGMVMKNGNVIRPFLTTPKDDLLEYLHTTGRKYCLDSSNADLSILRNRIRLELLPFMEEHYNPSLRNTLLQTAEILRGDDSYLDAIVQQKIAKCFRSPTSTSAAPLVGEVNLTDFLKQDLAIQRRMLEKIIWTCSSQPSFHHITEIIATANHGQSGTEIHLPRGLRLIKTNIALQFLRSRQQRGRRGSVSPPQLPSQEIYCNKSYTFPELGRELHLHKQTQPLKTVNKETLVLDYNKVNWPLVVRSPAPGERFSPAGMGGTKKINRYLADAKIPRHERCQYPLLVSNETIAAIVGLRADNAFAPDQSTREWLVVSWLPLSSEKQD